MPREPERYRAARGTHSSVGGNRTSPRRALSPEEKRRREIRRRKEEARREALAREREKLRRERRQRLFRLSLVAGVIFTVFYWCFVCISIVNRADGNEEALPLMLFTEGEREADKTIVAEEVHFDGKLYMPVKELEKYMAISQFGDYQTRSFLICESGEYATFYLDSTCAIVNGQRVALKEKAVLVDDQLYLPIDFYQDKMNCFTFTESAPLAANVLTFQGEVTPGMTFRQDEECAPVDVATVPAVTTPPEEEN